MTGRVLSLPIKDWVAVCSSAWGALHSSDQLGTAASISNSPLAISVVWKKLCVFIPISILSYVFDMLMIITTRMCLLCI